MPIFCSDYTTRKLKYCYLESGCEGKLLLYLRTDKFEKDRAHNLANKTHMMSLYRKYDYNLNYFGDNNQINYILIFRKYIREWRKEVILNKYNFI